MDGAGPLGKMLVVMGLVIIGIGLFLWLGDRIPWIGRLPGDILIRREKVTVYFPIVTCIIISLILTLLFSLFRK
jgi:hypothetical protein